jgi:hypothetical protein
MGLFGLRLFDLYCKDKASFRPGMWADMHRLLPSHDSQKREQSSRILSWGSSLKGQVD